MTQKLFLNEKIKISNDRIMIRKSSHVVICPAESLEETIPLSCPICKSLYRTIDDELSHREFLCCDLCSQQFARPNAKNWKCGWRPPHAECQDVISKREIFKQ